MTPPELTSSPAGRPAVASRRRLATRLILGVSLAVVVLSALAFFGDTRQLADALQGFAWWLALPILVLVLANYALRFVRWEIYLRRLDLPPIPRSTSLLVFIAGFSMGLTPGKIGEVIKSAYLWRLSGAPVGRTGAIVAAERLTDGVAMLVLASIGVTQFSYGRPLLAGAAVAALGVVVLLRRPHLLSRLIARTAHLPLVGRTVEHSLAFVQACADLLGFRLLTGAVALGAVAWAFECLAFFVVLLGLGLDPSWSLLLVATFVMAVSSVVGGLSMLPGGLGVADASVTAMLLLLLPDSIDRGTAVAATLLIRFATLWFAVLIGGAAVLLLQRRLRDAPPRPTAVTHGRGHSHGTDLANEVA